MSSHFNSSSIEGLLWKMLFHTLAWYQYIKFEAESVVGCSDILLLMFQGLLHLRVIIFWGYCTILLGPFPRERALTNIETDMSSFCSCFATILSSMSKIKFNKSHRVANRSKHCKHARGTNILKMRNYLGWLNAHKCPVIKTLFLRLPQLTFRLNEAASWAPPSFNQPH